MSDLYLLLRPRVLGLRNRIFRARKQEKKRPLIMGALALAFCGGMFVLSCRVLVYFQSVEMIGDILAKHLLSMVLLTFFCLLVFSNIITALSNLYLSKDLEFCHAAPVSVESLFVSRALGTFVDSSWMVMVFGLPVFMAYAWVYRPGPLFYVTLIHMNLALAIIASGLGILITVILVHIFPARRTKDIILLLSVLLVIALYLFFRFLRPERLVCSMEQTGSRHITFRDWG
ncbi:MAG: putative ABC transporter permease subunit, partial [Thermodesulfobacteriota bacterium]